MVGARGRIWGAQCALGVTASVLRAVKKRGPRGGNERHRRQCYDGNINNVGEPPRRGSVGIFPSFSRRSAHVYCMAGALNDVHRFSPRTFLDVACQLIAISVNNVYRCVCYLCVMTT